MRMARTGRPPLRGKTMPAVRLRVEKADWDALTEATDGQQAETTRQLIAWWLRRPGAKMPPRPAAGKPS